VRSENSTVQAILPISHCDVWINGGFFALKQAIFDHIKEGEELVLEPFQRLIKAGELTTYRHDGFWACMDTFKEKQILEDLLARGNSPWQVWAQSRAAALATA
jgi:glucose-1-phosphate cytidylyltransferase